MQNSKQNMDDIKKIRKWFYDDRAAIYDKVRWEGETSRLEIDGFKKLVKIEKDDIVLNIATGTGTFLIEMANKGAICYGLDISWRMLEQLKKKIEQAGLEERIRDIGIGEADRLPYADEFFDLVTCIGLFIYYPVEYAQIVLGQVRRVLKPDKRCFIDIVDPSNRDNRNRHYFHKYDLDAFEDIIRKMGFEIRRKNTAGAMIQYLLTRE